MLTKHLAHELTLTLPLWARTIAPIVEDTASRLLGMPVPTRLTQRSRMKPNGGISPKRKGAILKGERLTSSCLECGLRLEAPKRFCSSECRVIYRKEKLSPSFAGAGPATLKQRRSKNDDPAHGGEAGKKRGRSNRARSIERKTWDAAHSPEYAEKERARFKDEILPAIAECSLTQIVKTTGFCLSYASLIRSGKATPHPVHNLKLMELIRSSPEP